MYVFTNQSLNVMLTRPVTLTLIVTYPPTYPDVIPELKLEEIDEEAGELRDGEEDSISEQLRAVVSTLQGCPHGAEIARRRSR
jgi:hypothetical protein